MRVYIAAVLLIVLLPLAACATRAELPPPAPETAATAPAAPPQPPPAPTTTAVVVARSNPAPTATAAPAGAPVAAAGRAAMAGRLPVAQAMVAPRPRPADAPPLTLDDVFPPRDLSALGLDETRLRVLVATGDVIPARSVDMRIRGRGNDFFYPLAKTADLLRAGDVTVVNLEAPLIRNCPPHDDGMQFCGQTGFAAALKKAGVDVATLENNHIGNYGKAGIQETIKALEAQELAWADRDTPAIVAVRGLRFGFLAFTGIGERFNRPAIAEQIAALRPQVDVLVVAMHWGREYVDVPDRSPGIANDEPTDIAHFVIDAGADLIIGNHPHRVQAAEVYHDRFITYAHGNFIFDQMWSDETRTGVVGRYTFYDNALVGVEYTPVQLYEYAQPRVMEGKAAQAVLRRMEAASREQAHVAAKEAR
ncbi:MAG: CapA family protein [Anaerolineae bacterium]